MHAGNTKQEHIAAAKLEIESAKKAIEHFDSVREDKKLEALEVLAQATRALENVNGRVSSEGLIHTDDPALSRALGAMRPRPRNVEFALRADRETLDPVGRYRPWDPGWVEDLVQLLLRKKVPYPEPVSEADLKVQLPDGPLNVGIAGDWGTGLPVSNSIAGHMRRRDPSVTVHLGDVYYAGTEEEEKSNFLANWPRGSVATFALNSNHEMYCGGHGYFNVLLKDADFARHQKTSFFCLYNSAVQIVGLDSAYYADMVDPLFMKGKLPEDQIARAAKWIQEAVDNKRRLILMTHHNALDATGEGKDDGLMGDVRGAFKLAGVQQCQFRWLWGHEHAAAAFKPYPLTDGLHFEGRCIGHGGVPFDPLSMNDRLHWTETRSAAATGADQGRAMDGFFWLSIAKDGTLTETFVDEQNSDQWSLNW